MSNKSREIRDMLVNFNLYGPPELMVSKVLDILDVMNKRMDEIEAYARSEEEKP